MQSTLRCYVNTGLLLVIYFISSKTLTHAAKAPQIRLSEADIAKYKLWQYGTIPYYIDNFSFDKGLRDRVRSYLEEASLQTGLKFVELSQPPDDESTRWVLILNRRGLLECADPFDSNFTTTGVQRIVLGYHCGAGAGVINPFAAAVLALAGVPPQHNAPDRDTYIQVHEDNIMPDKLHLFKPVPESDWLFKGFTYDIMSASHYDYYMYSKNGRATITTAGKLLVPLFDDRVGLSFTDVQKIKQLYKNINGNLGGISQNCNKMYKVDYNNKKLEVKSTDTQNSDRVEKKRPKLGTNNVEENLSFPNKDNETFKIDRQDSRPKFGFKGVKKLKGHMKQIVGLMMDVDTEERF